MSYVGVKASINCSIFHNKLYYFSQASQLGLYSEHDNSDVYPS